MEKINAASMQKHIEIKEIKDDMVLLKNGGVRAVLMTTSLNFALRSIEEQDAIIYQYQNFLSSLDFSVQIVAASRKFDIAPYLNALGQKNANQKNPLLKIQTYEYIDFVKGLTEMTNIMTESFYVVVPYNPSIIKKSSFLASFLGAQKKMVKKQEIQEIKNNLWQRVEFAVSGLRGAGVKAVPLKTDELIELFYKLYNPSAKEAPEIKKSQELRMK